MCSRTFHFLSGAFVFALGVWATSFDRVGPTAVLAQASGVTSIVQGKIAFTSNRDGNDEIYVMNADGTGVTRLTDNPASDQQPAWSPDGSRIAFTSTRDGTFEIYVMNADGTGVTRLTTTTTHLGSTRPAWCGNRIAFESDRYLENFPDIFAMNEDGTGITRVTIDNASFDRQPAWSPACDGLAFTKDPSGNVEIYVMNADGTGATRLTNSVGYDQDPAWSPDGTQIAFASTRDDGTFHEIYVMNADGSAVRRLTDSPASDGKPAWSPDGSKIAFASNRDGDGEIYVMNADGTGVTQLTNNGFSDRDPSWSGTPAAETGAWPNEPAGFIQLNDQPWDDLTGSWSWLRRGSSKDPDIVADATARFSPQNVLRMIFTTDMENGSEPSVHWVALPGADEIYTAWWIKLSPNWTPSPGTAGQITYLFGGDGLGQVSTGFSHPCVWPEECNPEVQGPPYKITATSNWAPNGQQVWYPNVAATRINPGEWHRIEFYYRWETTPGVSGDGIIRWWVDGILNGDHTTVQYPPQRGFLELQYAPTLETAPPAEQYMYIDHTHLSVR
jgi:WD40 repeat protein